MNQGLNDRHVSLLAKTARITAEHPRCTGRANAAHTMGAGVPSTSQQRKPRLRARGMRLMWRSPHTGRARACAQCYTPPELIFPRGPEARWNAKHVKTEDSKETMPEASLPGTTWINPENLSNSSRQPYKHRGAKPMTPELRPPNSVSHHPLCQPSPQWLKGRSSLNNPS